MIFDDAKMKVNKKTHITFTILKFGVQTLSY